MCYSLPEFLKIFTQTFLSTSPAREAAKVFISLKQGKWLVVDYTVESHSIAVDSDWNQPKLIDMFLNTLSETLKFHLAPLDLPADFESLTECWRTRAQQYQYIEETSNKVILQSDSVSLFIKALVESRADINLIGFQIAKKLQVSWLELPQPLSTSTIDRRLMCKLTHQTSPVTFIFGCRSSGRSYKSVHHPLILCLPWLLKPPRRLVHGKNFNVKNFQSFKVNRKSPQEGISKKEENSELHKKHFLSWGVSYQKVKLRSTNRWSKQELIDQLHSRKGMYSIHGLLLTLVLVYLPWKRLNRMKTSHQHLQWSIAVARLGPEPGQLLKSSTAYQKLADRMRQAQPFTALVRRFGTKTATYPEEDIPVS